MDSLYICNWMGNVVEYVLEPRAKIGSEKVTDDSPLDVDESARAQWILSRSVMLHNRFSGGLAELTQMCALFTVGLCFCVSAFYSVCFGFPQICNVRRVEVSSC